MSTNSRPLPEVSLNGHQHPLSIAAAANRGFGDKLDTSEPVSSEVPLIGFPTGNINLGGIPYAVLDPIECNGCTLVEATSASAVQIPVGGLAGEWVHFLQAAANLPTANHSKVAEYIVRYQDGAVLHVPLHAGQEIFNWWYPRGTGNCQLVWTGTSERCDLSGVGSYSWRNPRPAAPVSEITLSVTHPEAIIDLIAVTIGTAPEHTHTGMHCSLFSRYGGWKRLQGRRTGFFHSECIDGKHWLVDPDGNAFLSKGVNAIRMQASPAKDGTNPYLEAANSIYSSEEAWAATQANRLQNWGFNTAGCWSSPSVQEKMPYVAILNVATRPIAGGRWFERIAADIFSDRFAQAAVEAAQELCPPRVTDPLLLGYLLDNELPWMRGADSHEHLLVQYLEFAPSAPGHREALRTLHDRYTTIESLNSAWNTRFTSFEDLVTGAASLRGRTASIDDPFTLDCQAFAMRAAERYYSVTTAAVRAIDSNHLILGTRVAWLNELNLPIVKLSARYLDVVSINNYAERPFVALFEEIARETGKPVLITEFAFRGSDTGHPNSLGAGLVVADQHCRARMAESFVAALCKSPAVVGYHWFCMIDQPYQGRKQDGENSNYGLLHLNDFPWPELTEAFRAMNRAAEFIHAAAAGQGNSSAE